jgi:hypothetical protein
VSFRPKEPTSLVRALLTPTGTAAQFGLNFTYHRYTLELVRFGLIRPALTFAREYSRAMM